jgi:hypothetical protein
VWPSAVAGPSDAVVCLYSIGVQLQYPDSQESAMHIAFSSVAGRAGRAGRSCSHVRRAPLQAWLLLGWPLYETHDLPCSALWSLDEGLVLTSLSWGLPTPPPPSNWPGTQPTTPYCSSQRQK